MLLNLLRASQMRLEGTFLINIKNPTGIYLGLLGFPTLCTWAGNFDRGMRKSLTLKILISVKCKYLLFNHLIFEMYLIFLSCKEQLLFILVLL